MRRRKNKNQGAIILMTIVMTLTSFLLKLIVRLITLIYDVITIHTTKYKAKSGNGVFKTYFIKGNYGEFILYRKVCRIFGKDHVLTNIYLDNVNTETTEIDVLAVSTKGIYVYEMKDYAGYIYGNQKDKYWMQVFNKVTKYKFFNPLRQNYVHTKAIENYLEVTRDNIVPIVVFSNRSKLSKITVDSSSNVYRIREALKFTKTNEKKAKVQWDEQKVQSHLDKLKIRCNVSEAMKQKHIEDVKELVEINN